MITEIFKDIPNYEGIYQVSNLGNVKSLNFNNSGKERILKKVKSGKYYNVRLYKEGSFKTKKIHLLVSLAFLNHKKTSRFLVVDHKDNNQLNNNLDNLQIIDNRKNRSKDIDKTKTSSKYIGVCWNKRVKKWISGIRIESKRKHLGYFNCETLAFIKYELELKKIQNEKYSI